MVFFVISQTFEGWTIQHRCRDVALLPRGWSARYRSSWQISSSAPPPRAQASMAGRKFCRGVLLWDQKKRNCNFGIFSASSTCKLLVFTKFCRQIDVETDYLWIFLAPATDMWILCRSMNIQPLWSLFQARPSGHTNLLTWAGLMIHGTVRIETHAHRDRDSHMIMIYTYWFKFGHGRVSDSIKFLQNVFVLYSIVFLVHSLTHFL